MPDGADGRGSPALVLLAHGTHDPVGQAALDDVRAAVAERVEGAPVVLAHLGPGPAPVDEVVEGMDTGVVVPYLLGAGYHVVVDLPELAASRPGLTVTEPLGPHPAVVTALAERVEEACDTPVAAVVLAAAGSSREEARDQAQEAGAALGRRLGLPSTVAFLSGPGTPVPEAVAWARQAAGGAGVVLASYLLSPGFFQDRLESVAADLGVVATAPVGVHPAVVELVASRYEAAAV